jgi:hypothetical protein
MRELLRRTLQKTDPPPKDRDCPSEEDVSSFVDGRMKAREENAFISHLAECKDCVEAVKFLRQKPSDEEAHVPAWLEEKVKTDLPVPPKTWEIVLEKVPPALEVVRHTAELCFTIPELKVIPAHKSFAFRSEKTSKRARTESECHAAEKESSYVPGKYAKPAAGDFQRRDRNMRDYEASMYPRKAEGEGFYIKKEAVHSVIESLGSEVSKGFVFRERLGDYSVHLFLSKKTDGETVEVQVETRDSSGQSVEDMEVLFIQGKKLLEKFLAKEGSHALEMPGSRRLRIKFRHKGVYLGEAILELRE